MKIALIGIPGCIAIALVVSACSGVKPIDLLNAVTPNTGYTVEEDIRYGSDARQTMDVYYPTTTASGHVIVFVYGGAWRKGDKNEYKFVAQALTSNGHTVAIPNYRLYPSVAYPDFVNDIVNAITVLDKAITGNAEYDHKLVIMGHSSGAHTAALLASNTRYLESTGISISALIAISGPYDLPMTNAEVTAVFGEASDHDKVKPVRLVTTEHPRTLLIHGTDDNRVDPDHTQRYSRALVANGVEVEKLMLEGAGHAESIAGLAAPLDRFNPIRETIQTFLD